MRIAASLFGFCFLLRFFLLEANCSDHARCQSHWFAEAEPTLSADEPNDWTLRKSRHNVTLESQGNLLIDWLRFKQEMTFIPAKSLYYRLLHLHFAHTPGRFREWSTTLQAVTVAKTIDQASDVLYLQFNSFLGVQARDMCVIRCKKEVDENDQKETTIVYRSIQDEILCPTKDGFTRAWALDWVERFRFTVNHNVSFTSIQKVAFGGWTPKAVVNLWRSEMLFGEIDRLYSSLSIFVHFNSWTNKVVEDLIESAEEEEGRISYPGS